MAIIRHSVDEFMMLFSSGSGWQKCQRRGMAYPFPVAEIALHYCGVDHLTTKMTITDEHRCMLCSHKNK